MPQLKGDVTRWTAVGERLAECDPQRFLQLLEIAERLVAVEDDPLSQPFTSVSCWVLVSDDDRQVS